MPTPGGQVAALSVKPCWLFGHELLGMQEKRVIEYVALGDYATAVGFLLASTPEKSARYYRDALCTLALAVHLLLPLCPYAANMLGHI